MEKGKVGMGYGGEKKLGKIKGMGGWEVKDVEKINMRKR